MKDPNEVKLSSGWTNVGVFGGAIVCLCITPLLYSIITKQEFNVGMVIAIGVYLLLSGFIIYQFLYVCDARVNTQQLTMKKLFRPAKVYSFDKIGEISSFRVKTTKYVTVEVENEDKSVEKYLIINSNALLSFEDKDAEDALIRLRNLSRY